MAVPKKKTSKARRNGRRAHHALAAPGLIACPNCGEPHLPHRVCRNCGFYKGREVVRKNLPQAIARDELIALIKEHGRWKERA